MDYDVVVVGGGAAGLSAAMVLARARRRVAVVDAGEPRNAPAAHVHGFLSRDGVSPAWLLEVGRGEVIGYGGEVIEGRARGIEHEIALTSDERERLTARGIRIVDGHVTRLVLDDDRLSAVELADGRVVSRAAVFVGPPLRAA